MAGFGAISPGAPGFKHVEGRLVVRNDLSLICIECPKSLQHLFHAINCNVAPSKLNKEVHELKTIFWILENKSLEPDPAKIHGWPCNPNHWEARVDRWFEAEGPSMGKLESNRCQHALVGLNHVEAFCPTALS